jgi:peptidoglycan/xylan/chitin deacetylase (PgdA/CDA1 family)
MRSRSLILCYHAVSDAWDHALAVPVAAMSQHLRGLLRRGYVPVDAAEALTGRARRLHVTFDDAYQSVATAVPTLERLGVSATVFACTDYAEDGKPLAIPELAAEAAAHPDELETMTWEQLSALSDRGIEIGSHTVTHAHLTRLSDHELDRELCDSRARMEEVLRRQCRYLAYPYGEDDHRVHAAAHRAGYEAAFTLKPKAATIDAYAVPRVDLYRRDGLVRAMLKTSPVREPASALLGTIRSVRGR